MSLSSPLLGAHLPVTPLDPVYEADFDRVTRVAARVLRAPVAQFNVVTDTAQITASAAGPSLGPRSVGLDASYCQYVVGSREPLLIENARTDPLVCDNRATTEVGIGAYAGVPVVLPDGTVAGALCVVDFVPRQWTAEDQALLDDLAASLAGRLELARHAAEHARARAYLDHVLAAGAAHLYAVGIVGSQFVTHWISPSVERMLGYTPAEAVEPTWWFGRLHPDDRSVARTSVAELCERGTVLREYRLRHRAGHYLWVRDQMQLVRDAHGQPVEAIGSWVDISDRKAAEAALRRAHAELEARVQERTAELTQANAELRREVERREATEAALARTATHYRSLIEHAPDMISLIDATGTILYQSPSVERVLGYPVGSLDGASMVERFHPADRNALRAAFARILADPSRAHQLRHRIRHADGSWRVLEVVGRSHVDDPALGAVVFNARDVTERVAAETRFRAIFEQAAVGMAAVAPDGRWLRANARLAEIVGYDAATLRTLTVQELLHPDDRPDVQAARARLLAGEVEVQQAERRYVHRDGHVLWALVTTSLVRDATDAPDYFILVVEDVTERRRTAEELRLAPFEVLERLAQAAEFRDDDTGQHTRRVGDLAGAIAAALDLPADDVALIRRAAPLHDVGKIGVPDAILLKPGRLTPGEMERMRTHARIGAQLLAGSSAPLIRMAEVIAQAHHERWDGTGYPDGLAAEAIPLPARIVAVADFYDALTSDRVYRPAWPVEQALAEVAAGAGTHFDPRVAHAFLALAGTEPAAEPASGGEAPAPGTGLVA